jgi:membrane protein implicated in regulation of membrane protease activity
METVQIIYLICFLVGATLMVCQFVLSLVGIGGDHDVDAGHDFHDAEHHGHHGGHDHGSSWFVGVLTFRTVVAALAFFGLAGLASYGKLEPVLNVMVALAAGASAMVLVAFLMRSLHRLKAEGTVRIERAVGQKGTVYLTIPGQKSGVGKVHLSLQNRTVEYQAVTPQEQLPTGSRIVVTAVVGADTVEVVPVAVSEITTTR